MILRSVLSIACLAGLLSSPAGAAHVLQMNLDQMTSRAERIFRGTFVDSSTATVEAGGGEIPIVVYRFRAVEVLKGQTGGRGEHATLVEVRMVGFPSLGQGVSAKHRSARRSILPELPGFEVGSDYLLLLTSESRIGTSTTVGLGQGLFRLIGDPGSERAFNSLNNVGLFRGAPRLLKSLDPERLTYSELRQLIQRSAAN